MNGGLHYVYVFVTLYNFIIIFKKMNSQNNPSKQRKIWCIYNVYNAKMYENTHQLIKDCKCNDKCWKMEVLIKSPYMRINHKDDDGNTALIYATQHNGDYNVRRLLENKNINIYVRNKSNKTAIDICKKKEIMDLFNVIIFANNKKKFKWLTLKWYNINH